MDPLRTGARLLSRGMRQGNTLLTLVGALLTARAIARWLDRPDRELLHTRRLRAGESMRIVVEPGSES